MGKPLSIAVPVIAKTALIPNILSVLDTDRQMVLLCPQATAGPGEIIFATSAQAVLNASLTNPVGEISGSGSFFVLPATGSPFGPIAIDPKEGLFVGASVAGIRLSWWSWIDENFAALSNANIGRPPGSWPIT